MTIAKLTSSPLPLSGADARAVSSSRKIKAVTAKVSSAGRAVALEDGWKVASHPRCFFQGFLVFEIVLRVSQVLSGEFPVSKRSFQV